MISLAGLDPRVRPAVSAALAWAKHYGLHVTVTSAKRERSKQAALYRQYLACKARHERIDPSNPNPACRYPANPPGDSAHEYGMAFDSAVPAGEWGAWTDLRRALGWRVPDNDRVHAEVQDWREKLGLA